MQVIANVDTKDNYDAALTIEDNQANLLAFTVANASAIARLRPGRRESGGDQSYGPEILITPQSLPVPNVSGVKFRSAVAGTPARIIATLVGPDDPQLGAGIPFAGTLAASGEVTAAGGGATLPAGVVVPTAGIGAVPAGWLPCDGSSYDASAPGSDKLALWQAIGTQYGGTGQNNFFVPDLRGRVVAGLGTHADVAALGNNEGHATANRRPRHYHDFTVFNSGAGSNPRYDAASAANPLTFQTSPGAAGSPKDTPAYLVLAYLISLGA